MRLGVLLAAGTLSSLLALPALASPCEDDIRALDARVNDAASRSAALSGGGEGVAASRQAQAMQAEAQRPTGAPAQKLPEHDVNATAAVTPLAGGDRPLKAKAALDRARTFERDGNAAACGEAVAEARRELGPAQ